MTERIVSLNGSLVSERDAVISVFDRSVQYGDAVYDAARTFGHRPFKLGEHIDRLYRSCAYTRMPLRLSPDDMEKRTLEVLDHNLTLLGPDDDEVIWWSVTRGRSSARRVVTDAGGATVIIYTFPVPFGAFAGWVTQGARVVIPSTRRTPPQCVDPRAKISNKMNHILADLEAKGADPEAYSLMLDVNGHIAENSGGNFFFARQGTLCTSGSATVLEGITRATVLDLARAAGVPAVTGDFTLYDLSLAEEAFLTTTSFSILPVARVNGAPVGERVPGPLTRALMKGWSELVGIDIVAQALRHLTADPAATPAAQPAAQPAG